MVCHASSIATAERIAGWACTAARIKRGRGRLSAKQRMLIEHIAETRPAMRALFEM